MAHEENRWRFRTRTSACAALYLVAGLAGAATIPNGTWDRDRADSVESALDTFFAATDPAERDRIFRSDLAPQDVGLTLDELLSIAKADPPNGQPAGKPGVWRLQYPWRPTDPRGWFNFSMPAGYTPNSAWGLVLALHGAGGNGDGVVRFYTPQLNDLGFFVIYPSVIRDGRGWNRPEHREIVHRLITWAGRRYRIDFRRLVVTGLSMGAGGAWLEVIEHPELWSAGAAVASHPARATGELTPCDFFEPMRGIPFYMLHGDQDQVVSVEVARTADKSLNQCNIDHVYVEAPGAGHTPPDAYWRSMNAWIAQQPAKPYSPRPLFIPPPGKKAVWGGTGANQAPIVRMASPANGAAFGRGETVPFAVEASDADLDRLSYAWTIDGQAIGETEAAFGRAFAGAGTYRIAVRVSDGRGGAAAALVVITVNRPPTVRITAPADGAIFLYAGSESVAFAADAADPDGDAVTYAWSSDLDGRLGTSAGLNLAATELQEGRHRITLTVSDDAGAAASAAIVFSVFRDLDRDGLGDLWEVTYGLDPTRTDSDGNGTPDADEDPDQDGASNRDEFLAGTDPHAAPSGSSGSCGAAWTLGRGRIDSFRWAGALLPYVLLGLAALARRRCYRPGLQPWRRSIV